MRKLRPQEHLETAKKKNRLFSTSSSATPGRMSGRGSGRPVGDGGKGERGAKMTLRKRGPTFRKVSHLRRCIDFTQNDLEKI